MAQRGAGETGSMFSGFLRIQPGWYRKRFAVDEFVLNWAGEKLLIFEGQPAVSLGPDEIAGYRCGGLAERRIETEVKEFFVGR